MIDIFTELVPLVLIILSQILCILVGYKLGRRDREDKVEGLEADLWVLISTIREAKRLTQVKNFIEWNYPEEEK